jgi:hypothetical protein
MVGTWVLERTGPLLENVVHNVSALATMAPFNVLGDAILPHEDALVRQELEDLRSAGRQG